MKNISPTYKGLITGILMIAITLLFFYVLKKPFNGKEQYAIYIIYILGIIWSLLDFKKNATTDTKFKDYFSVGFKTFIVVTLLMVIFTFIFYSFNTQIRDDFAVSNSKLLLAEGNKTQVEIAENEKQFKKIFMSWAVGVNTFKYLIIGVLITVVGAGFLSSQNKA